MSEWYDIPEEERTHAQKEDALSAYYQTFLASVYGRQCYADMRRRVRELDKLMVNDTDYAVGIIMMDDFMRETRLLCGITDEMVVIIAEQNIGISAKIPEEVPDHPREFRE